MYTKTLAKKLSLKNSRNLETLAKSESPQTKEYISNISVFICDTFFCETFLRDFFCETFLREIFFLDYYSYYILFLYMILVFI